MRYYPSFMRFVLTMAFLAAASLRGAELGVPVSTSPAAVQAGPLSLEKAIDRTLCEPLTNEVLGYGLARMGRNLSEPDQMMLFVAILCVV